MTPIYRRTRTNAALAVALATTSIACLTGSFFGVAWLLSGVPEPPAREATFATAEEWPEIKNGVPELASAKTSRSTRLPSNRSPATFEKAPAGSVGSTPDAASVARTAPQAPSASDALNAEAPVRNTPTSQSVVPPSRKPISTASTTATDAIARAEPMVGSPAVEGTPPAALAASASTLLTPRPEMPFQTESAGGGSTGDAQQSGPRPTPTQVESRTRENAGETMAPSSHKAAEAQEVSAAVASPSSPDGAAGHGKSAAKQQGERAVRSQRNGTDAQGARAVAQPSPSTKTRSTSKAELERRKEKLARQPRTRTASAQPQESSDASPRPAAAQPAEENERVHLLGIPLPTGRKIKECLLELRC